MNEKRRDAGFTLIEIMVVMAIIAMLAAMVGPQLIRRQVTAQKQATRAQIEMFGTALDMFRLDVGRYPTTQEGLQALRQPVSGTTRWDGPYLKKQVPKDPWDHDYVYRSPGQGGRPYDLESYGEDGTPGGEGDAKDITSWDG
jgi:general secretion pathway protein G